MLHKSAMYTNGLIKVTGTTTELRRLSRLIHWAGFGDFETELEAEGLIVDSPNNTKDCLWFNLDNFKPNVDLAPTPEQVKYIWEWGATEGMKSYSKMV